MINECKLKEFLEKSKNILDQNNTCRDNIFFDNDTYKAQNVVYGIDESPYGKVLLAKTEKGISDLLFVTTTEDDFILKLFNKWPKAVFLRDDAEIKKLIEKIFYSKEQHSIKLHLTGTDFQMKVWQALLKIPEGYLLSYSDIASYINHPYANRAVGTAIGKNPIHYLIPCHRVIRNDGVLGGFAGGLDLKQALLRFELNLVK